MIKILKVRSPEETTDVLRIIWTNGSSLIAFSDPMITSTAKGWISRGFIELVRGTEGELNQQVTKSRDPEFLDRIAASLRDHYGYEASVVTLA